MSLKAPLSGCKFLLLLILLLYGFISPRLPTHYIHYTVEQKFLKQLWNFSNKNILKGIIIFICFFQKHSLPSDETIFL